MNINIAIIVIIFAFGIGLMLLAFFNKTYPKTPLIVLSVVCFIIGGFISYTSYTLYQSDDVTEIYTDSPAEVKEYNENNGNIQASK